MSVSSFSVAVLSSGWSDLYNYNRYFLILNKSEKTLSLMVYLATISSSDNVCFGSSCTLSPQSLKFCDRRYDIDCFYHIPIIQKNACLYNKIQIKFLPSFAYESCSVACYAVVFHSEVPSQGSFCCS